MVTEYFLCPDSMHTVIKLTLAPVCSRVNHYCHQDYLGSQTFRFSDSRNFAVEFYPLPEGYCFTSDTPLTLAAPSPFTLSR